VVSLELQALMKSAARAQRASLGMYLTLVRQRPHGSRDDADGNGIVGLEVMESRGDERGQVARYYGTRVFLNQMLAPVVALTVTAWETGAVFQFGG